MNTGNVDWMGTKEIADFLGDLSEQVIYQEYPKEIFPLLSMDGKTRSVHFYSWLHPKSTVQRSSIWIWDSKLKSYVHFTGKAPPWWNEIDLELKVMTINSINANRERIDDHINKILAEMPTKDNGGKTV